MPHRTLRRVMLSFAVVIVAVSALTLLGCPGGGGNVQTQNVNQTIPLNATNASNGTAAIVNGFTFAGIPGAVFAQNAVPAAPQLQNQTASLSFANVSGATGNFTLTTPNVTLKGIVRFASCTFTVTETNNAPVVPVGTVFFIADCTITVSATGVPVGSTIGTAATITLSLNGVPSQLVNTTVEIQANGTLVVTSGTGTPIVTTVIITITGSPGTSSQ